jgi:hypothetical protein
MMFVSQKQIQLKLVTLDNDIWPTKTYLPLEASDYIIVVNYGIYIYNYMIL